MKCDNNRLRSTPRMNTALKHWKEAATVILAAGKRHKLPDGLSRCVDRTTFAPPGLSNLPHIKSAFDYDVLMLKRSGKSGFMPNAYVFPGGLADPSDFSSEWLHVFRAFRRSPNFGLASVKQPPETRPPIFATDRMKLGSPIPGDVAFRICAVRETFEESGVLLVVPKEEERRVLESVGGEAPGASSLTRLHQVCEEGELARWRALVNQDPGNFIRMCRELGCLPNIWALHEWGNWLTPVAAMFEKRFDTAFFICCLQETPPHTLQDQKEIVDFKWSSPPELLHSYRSREMWIAPPQFYDLSRVCRHPSLSQLHRFASQRAAEGCEQFLPVRLVTDDARHISLLPGDMLYPEDDSGHVDVSTGSLEEEEEQSSAFHRVVWLDLYSADIRVTITPKYSHLPPVQPSPLPHGTKSQL